MGLSVSRLSSDHLPFSRWLVSDLTGLRQSSSAMVTNGSSVSSLEKCDKLSQSESDPWLGTGGWGNMTWECSMAGSWLK